MQTTKQFHRGMGAAKGWIPRRFAALAWLLALGAGLAVESRALAADAVDLGSADSFALLGLSGSIQISNGSTIGGDVGLVPSGKTLSLSSGSTIAGNAYVHSGSTFSNTTGNGQKVTSNDTLLQNAYNGATSAESTAAELGTSASFRTSQKFTLESTTGTISSNTTLSLGTTAGNFVYNFSAVNLSNGTLTISGNSADRIVLDISGAFMLSNASKIVLSGGLTASDVLFNVEGTGTSVNLTGGSQVTGTILATKGTADITNNSTVRGQVIAGSIGSIAGSSSVVSPDF